MRWNADSLWRSRLCPALLVVGATVGLGAAFTRDALPADGMQVDMQKVMRGRALVIEHACGACHGGPGPESQDWLAGVTRPEQEFLIGPCLFEAGAKPCFRTRPRNLTPDNLTGLGRFTERQMFNALRFGLRPGETGDMEITSSTPGQGNFPANPKYMAPPMPWTGWRHMPDDDLWAIAAYLKHGVKPVRNRVADSEGPPDFWASDFAPGMIGPHPAESFPTPNEVMLAGDGVDPKQVRRGRQVVIQHDCGGCHGGGDNPAAEGWLAGIRDPTGAFPIGPCAIEPGATPCYIVRPRNLTPDDETGLGRFSERQIFNALRFGLRPSETPDVEITSSTPGEGNFPVKPDYLAPGGMPWPAWRHISDEDLWAVAAYLKHGLKPVHNEVEDSDRPADLWAGDVTVERLGLYPAPPFPTAREVGR